MRRISVIVAAFALVVMFVGCAVLPMESNIKKPVSMTDMGGNPVKSFSQTSKALWFFWGAMPFSLPTVDQVVGPEVADYAGVQNLKITMSDELLDMIITGLTGSIVVVRTVKIEGQVYE